MRCCWVAVGIYCGVAILAPGTALAEMVTLKGIVTNSEHKPVASARVIAVPDQQRYWLPDQVEPLANATANAEGEFKLSVPTTGPVALIGWSQSHRMTKFPVNPQAAGERVIGLALDKGFTLSGKVTDAATGEPIGSAEVGPLMAGLDTQTQRAQRVVQQWTQTDQEGKFILQGLATDIDHAFLVRKSGYVINNVELSRGTDEVTVRLDKGGSAVSGEVFARGEPQTAFANVLVRANGNGFDVITRTDAQSRFQIEGLPGGTFSVEPIMLEGERSAKVEVVEMPADNGTSISLEVSAGYTVSGTTFDMETSAPAAGVTIGLSDHWTSSTSDGTFSLGPFFAGQQISLSVPEEAGWQLADVQTGNEYDSADGFSNVSNVQVKVRRQRNLDVTLDNFGQTTAPVVITVLHSEGKAVRVPATTATVSVPVYTSGQYAVYATSGGMASEVESVSVGVERSVPVTVALMAGADVTGRLVVTNTNETTRVQTLRLALHTTHGSGAGAPVFLGTSPRADGTFNLKSMPSGNFVLSVSNRSNSHQTTRPITLLPGYNDLGEIAWKAGNRLAGDVRSATDTPIPYAQVGLLLPDETVLRAETDEEGHFSFDDIYADSITGLMVEAGSYAIYRESDIPLPQDQMRIIMQALGKLNITVDAPAGTPWNLHIVRMSRWALGTYADQLVGNTVVMRDAMGGETVEIGLGEKGSFRAIAVSESNSEIRVSPPFDWAGEAATGQSITLASNSTGRITGTVDGANVPVEVTVMNMAIPEQVGRDKAEQTVAVSNGRYQAADLPPGNYLVLAQGETYSGYVLNVELRPGETTTADLAPIQPAVAEGTVQLAGQPLPQATVSLASETDPSFSTLTATTDASGRFSFPGLLPDTYSLSANYRTESGELTTRKTVSIAADTPTGDVTLDLTPPKPVLFSVDPAMQISAEADVNLMNKQTRQLSKAHWIDGRLEAEVAPGEYEIWLGDAVAGVATVSDDGTGHMRKQ